MEYVQMLKDPELVLGFKELLNDREPLVVKRTMRVFSLVYHHALKLVGTNSRSFREEDLLKVWIELKDVVDTILGMVNNCDNEGILIHIIRFLDAAIQAHLSPDLHDYPKVLECGRDVVRKGLKCLKDLVTTPYINGTSFILAIKSLISVACIRKDLHDPVGELIIKQFSSLPPTLFDHNVRSFYKMLQRNLVLFLKIIDSPSLRGRIVEIAVKSGVQRKIIAQYMPGNDKKRPVESAEETGQPQKRIRPDSPKEKEIKMKSPPAKVRDHVREPQPLPGSRSSTPEKLDEIPDKNEVSSMKNLTFLTSLLPQTPKKEATITGERAIVPVEKKVDEELWNRLNEKLDITTVTELVLSCLPRISDEQPEDFVSILKERGIFDSDINKVKQNISTWLIKNNIIEKLIPMIAKPGKITKKLSTENKNLNIEQDANSLSPKSTTMSPPPSLPSASIVDQKSQPLLPVESQASAMDTDLRSLFPVKQKFDVDMRIMDPRLMNREKELKNAESKNFRDPRLTAREGRMSPGNQDINRDPRASKAYRDPRLANKDDKKHITEASGAEIAVSRDPRMASRTDPRLDAKRASPKIDTKKDEASPMQDVRDPRLRKDQPILLNPAQLPPQMSFSMPTAMPPHIDRSIYNSIPMSPHIMSPPSLYSAPQHHHHLLHSQQFGMGVPSMTMMNGQSIPMNARPQLWPNPMQNGPILMNGQMPSGQPGMLQPSLMNL